MVEKGRLSPWEHLLGPYDTFEEASKALETAEKRSDAWDEADADWKGED
ncbi:MAG: SPOR domain-containing protein [Demequina sp.]|nr:SPOR domain-containing protein [Demequina sp.]